MTRGGAVLLQSELEAARQLAVAKKTVKAVTALRVLDASLTRLTVPDADAARC